ncbi:hypothetical protein AMS68_005803 [Peltaster fructicola]|uniref:Importin N-terminal domain-containing protein n=1 Tax=Peltaster fructicola TaxID=286661 RepID=A0A6H0Y022_9PEZI|nr:hypothetical protein AMS68_005803 [Peltaster fructicola]
MLPDSNGTNQSQAEAIHQALNATLDPHVTNDIRRQALEHLEQVKTQPDAPYHGFTLASDPQQPQAVRYYGLQLLEYVVRYQWSQYSDGQTEQLRAWIVTLAQNVTESDAAFHRNKVGQLWAECAKRSWGEQWLTMDMQLCNIWEDNASNKQPANRILVLYILEMLAEDICNREDATAGLRLDVLGSALNEIVIPQELYRAHLEGRAKGRSLEVRHGQEGWLTRTCNFAAECMKQVRMNGSSASYRLCATKALNTLRTFVAWVSLKAVIEVSCISGLLLALYIDNVGIRIAALDTLHAILSRPDNPHTHELEIQILHPVLQAESISLLASIFKGSQFMPSSDDELYLLQRKTSELLSVTADALLQHGTGKFNDDGVNALFGLLIDVFQNQSLLISIPILHSWTRLLNSQDQKLVRLVIQVLPTLVDVCSQRLLNFEMLPEDFDSTMVQYLYQDFETMPERHAFLGNYRRYALAVIEIISRQRPIDAMTHVFGALYSMLESGQYCRERGFQPAQYAKTGLTVLRFDAQFAVAVGVIKGYMAWVSDGTAVEQDDAHRADTDAKLKSTSEILQQWCLKVINTPIHDPEVASHVITLLSSIARNTRAGREIVLPIVHYLLTTNLSEEPLAAAYTDSLRGFDALRVLELQKIALVFANELFEYYGELEDKVSEITRSQSNDDRVIWGLRAFLFIITQRTTRLNDSERANRLQRMIDPVVLAWQDHALQQAVASTNAFWTFVGLGDLPGFYQQHHFAEVEDWAAEQLNGDGQARQASIKNSVERLPLRMTKALLGATTEKLKDGSTEHDVACALWDSSIRSILPALLHMIRHAQAFNNLERWSQQSPEVQAVVRRTLQDRFWQSGISNETRDDFYKRISGSKSSYEGFASTVRGTMRNIREQGYHIVFLFTKFEEQFYGFADLPVPLAEALFDDADSLSTHHLQAVVNLATGLLQRCPPQYRHRFLPPLLTRMFAKLDKKISTEWETIVRVNQETAEDDDLSEEMRIESVLRQLTYSMVSFVSFLLDYEKQMAVRDNTTQQRPTLPEVVLTNVSILEPLIMFCTHALRMRDTRCCTLTCKILVNMIPEFATDIEPAPRVREFISTEVLKAGITSLNEPYFADMQRDLAALLAQILFLYSPKSATPRNVLLSLPNMEAARVDSTIEKLARTKSARQQRALVLDLLEGVRGVSIHESGKIARQIDPKPIVQAQYMDVEQKPSIVDGDDTGLDGIGSLFGDA